MVEVYIGGLWQRSIRPPPFKIDLALFHVGPVRDCSYAGLVAAFPVFLDTLPAEMRGKGHRLGMVCSGVRYFYVYSDPHFSRAVDPIGDRPESVRPLEISAL